MPSKTRFLISLFAFSLCIFPLTAFGQNSDSEESANSRKITNFWHPGDPGERLYIDGRVLDQSGRAIANAKIQVWQADGDGNYHDDRYRGVFTTGKDGGYAFGTVLPGQYYSVKHIHVIVVHDNYSPLETRIIFKGDPNLDEVSDRRNAIFLEKAEVKGETVLFGRFDITLK